MNIAQYQERFNAEHSELEDDLKELVNAFSNEDLDKTDEILESILNEVTYMRGLVYEMMRMQTGKHE